MKTHFRNCLPFLIATAAASISLFAPVRDAQASLHLTPVAGLNFYQGNFDPAIAGNDTSGDLGFTYGVLGSADLDAFFQLETGVLSNGNKFDVAGTSNVGTWDSRSIEIPAMLRFTGIPLLSFGAGLYFEHFSDGDFNSASGVKTAFSWSKSSTLGYKFDGRVHLPFFPLMSIILDLSFKHGFSQRSVNAGTLSVKDQSMNLLAGLEITL